MRTRFSPLGVENKGPDAGWDGKNPPPALRRDREQGVNKFPCLADHEQVWPHLSQYTVCAHIFTIYRRLLVRIYVAISWFSK